MSSDPIPETVETEISPVEQLRAEFAEQIKTLKETFAEDVSKRDALIQELKVTNEDLRRSLIRTTTITPEVKPLEKTDAEIYQDKVDELAKIALGKMQEMR